MLARLAARQLRSHPWQLGLAILGIALGVAVAVSIDLANASALRAFGLATEAVSGRATHQILGGPSGLPNDLSTRRRLLSSAALPDCDAFPPTIECARSSIRSRGRPPCWTAGNS